MIPLPSGVKVWLATGHTDMRKGFPGLSLMVQEALKRDPMCGHLFVFRGRGGGLIKASGMTAREPGIGHRRPSTLKRPDLRPSPEAYGHIASDQITSRTRESEIGLQRNPHSDSAFDGCALVGGN